MKLVLCSLLALLLSACALLPDRAGPITIEREHADAMARMVSDYRRANGLGPVRVDAALMAAAEQQARTVAARDRLDHGNFEGRIHRHRVDTERAFENLAAGDPTPRAALATWKASPAHQRALVSPTSTRIGYVRALAPGTRHRTFDVLVLASD
ncbi:CAP domain-containing protein [Salinarimonas chemoclinalis]|uniref:CAP domain-containing protein n=1 Tax=Salinarimonas chemoclinalis TaxID=3241599 RepID=UPI003557D3A9